MSFVATGSVVAEECTGPIDTSCGYKECEERYGTVRCGDRMACEVYTDLPAVPESDEDLPVAPGERGCAIPELKPM